MTDIDRGCRPVCERHCLFNVGPDADIAELHDLSYDPAHAATLGDLSNLSALACVLELTFGLRRARMHVPQRACWSGFGHCQTHQV